MSNWKTELQKAGIKEKLRKNMNNMKKKGSLNINFRAEPIANKIIE